MEHEAGTSVLKNTSACLHSDGKEGDSLESFCSFASIADFSYMSMLGTVGAGCSGMTGLDVVGVAGRWPGVGSATLREARAGALGVSVESLRTPLVLSLLDAVLMWKELGKELLKGELVLR